MSQTDLGLWTVCVQKHHFIEHHLMLFTSKLKSITFIEELLLLVCVGNGN